jgi:hypothetical protein
MTPGDLRILAVSVVVPTLRPSELIGKSQSRSGPGGRLSRWAVHRGWRRTPPSRWAGQNTARVPVQQRSPKNRKHGRGHTQRPTALSARRCNNRAQRRSHSVVPPARPGCGHSGRAPKASTKSSRDPPPFGTSLQKGRRRGEAGDACDRDVDLKGAFRRLQQTSGKDGLAIRVGELRGVGGKRVPLGRTLCCGQCNGGQARRRAFQD